MKAVKLFISILKYLLVILGIIIAVTSFFIVLIDPNLAALIPTQQLIAIAGYDYFVIGTVAAFALLLSLIFAITSRNSKINQAETPDPEVILTVPTLGDDFDELLSSDKLIRGLSRDEKQQIVERLTKAATESVSRIEGCSRDQATELVLQGKWTTNKYANYLLSQNKSVGPMMLQRARYSFSGNSWFAVCASRTADAISSYIGISIEGE